MGFSKDNLKGVLLALLSSGFIGASFIIKKKGLRKAAAASGVRAGDLFISIFPSNFGFSFTDFDFLKWVFIDFCRVWRVFLPLGASVVGGIYYQ